MMKSTVKAKECLAHGLLGVGMVILVAGCTSGLSTKVTESANSGFMSLWNTYADCKSTSDLGQAVGPGGT
jgi:hypothetical protein